jgi:hypothetical protein
MEHGRAALERVAIEDPSTFVRVAASLLPKQVELEERAAQYIISDQPMTADQWEAEYCKPRDTPLITN